MTEPGGEQTVGARCVLAVPAPREPWLLPMAFWDDGRALWMLTPAQAPKARTLERDPACSVYLPPEEADGPGLLGRGSARVFRPSDLLGLAVHGPTIGLAAAALLAKEAPSLVELARELARSPSAWLPGGFSVVRVLLEERQAVGRPAVDGGVAPALPTVIPADVRRVLSGKHRVLVGARIAASTVLRPAVWSAGLELTTPEGPAVPDGTAVSVLPEPDGAGRGAPPRGACLRGVVAAGRLVCERVTWWRGFTARTVDVPAPGAGDIELPE